MTRGNHGKGRLWIGAGGAVVLLALAGGGYYKLTPHGAGGYYQDGEKLLKKGDVAAALIQFRNAVQKAPDDGKMRLALGEALLLAGDPVSAETELKAAERYGIAATRVDMPLAHAYLNQAKFEEVLKSVPENAGTPAAQIETLLVRGYADLGLHQYDAATADFTAAAKLNAKEPRAYIGLARVAIGQGKIAEADPEIDQALKLAPKDAEALALKGEIERLSHHADQAVKYFDQALAADPNQLLAHIGRAVLLIDGGKLDDADKDVEAVLKLSPHHPVGNYLKALLLARRKQPGDAIDVLEREQNALTYPPSLFLLGTLQYQQKQLEQARTNLESYLRLAPGDARARIMLGDLLLGQGLGQQAVDTLKPGADETPPNPELLAALGNAYLRVNQPSKALDAFNKAAALAPNNANTRTEVAVGRLRVGQSEEAIKDLEAAIETDPKDQSARVLLVLTHLRRGELDPAQKAAESLAAAEPKNPLSYNLLGAVAEARQDTDGARTQFGKALALQPKFTPAHVNLAQLDARLGDPKKAAEEYQDILKYDPKNLDALTGLANLSFAQQKPADGIVWLQKARDNNPNETAPRLRLIAAYLAARDPQKALTEAQELQVTAPNQPAALDALGQAQLASGKAADAVTTFRQLTVVLPKSPQAQQRLASALFATKDVAGARHALDQALTLDPNFVTAKADLIDMAFEAGDKKGAVQQAEDWRKSHPKEASADILVGDTELKAGMPREAEADYTLAMTKQPTTAVALRQAQALSAAGNLAGAVSSLQAWIGHNEKDSLARMALANYQLQQKQYPEAAAEYETLNKQSPGNAAVLNNLAWVYGQLGNAKAIPTAEEAYKLAPKSSAVADTLGYLLVQKGDKAKGVTLLDAAHKLAPTESAITYHLAVGLNATGKTDQARALLAKLLAGGKTFDDQAAAQALYRKLGGK